MQLLKFFVQDSELPKGTIIFASTIAGLSGGLLLALINSAADLASHHEPLTQSILVYILTLSVFAFTKRTTFFKSISAAEAVVRKIRVRVSNKIRHAELDFIENIGQSNIYTALTQDISLISQSVSSLLVATQSVVIVLFSFIYIAWLSAIGFVLTLITLALIISLYWFLKQGIAEQFELMSAKENEFFDTLNHALEGFKEIKLNQQKNDELFIHIETLSQKVEELKVHATLQLLNSTVFANIASYLLLGVIVFGIPPLVPSHSEVVVKITAATLFLLGPLDAIIGSIPVLARANTSAENIYQLEMDLDAVNQAKEKSEKSSGKALSRFNTLQLDSLSFDYKEQSGEASFHIESINLIISSGEIIFIVGGNGSGKSTLLKLLTGLYYPASGHILVDDEEIEVENYPIYRELFSSIFTDFHLFDRLYGLAEIDEHEIEALLRLMELSEKTKYVDGKFSHLNLSTGQKKRLAFIAAVLEDKPIYIFDELAADQDPQFRKYFYEVILPDLKNKGKTIIAVTHDDKYFHQADRIFKMEYGKLLDYHL